MSAKRLKIEGMNGERASRTRARSFSSPQAVAEEEGDHHELVDRQQCVDNLLPSTPAASPGNDRQRGGLNMRGENLVRIESALSLHRNFRKPNSLLSFDEFYALLGKVPLHADAAAETDKPSKARTTKEGSLFGDNRSERSNVALSEDERHLYHLLRVAVPILYNVCLLSDDEAKQRRHDALSSSISGRSDTKQASDGATALASPKKKMKMNGCPRRYYLVKVEFPGNRIKELRRLVREYDPLTIVHEDILAAIVKHREASSSTSSSSRLTDSKKRPAALDGSGSDQAVIRAGMTIDERVGARERARLKRNEDVARTREDAVEAGETTMDREWLVRVSDALWRRSADILATQNRGSNQQTSPHKRKVSFCTLTLKDAVSVLRKALASPGANSHDKKTTSQALVEAIVELAKLGPKWIQLTRTGEKNERASKDDTVWIYHSHYQEARALISGKCPPAKPSIPEGEPVRSDASKSGESASKRRLDTPARVATSDDHGATSNLPKKQRHDLMSLDVSTPVRRKQDPLSTSTNEMTPPPASASKKPSLRINPHLILSDADYTGGEIIVPSFFDSPRGLKILFDEINAGKRI